MNMFIQEWKANAKALLIWSLGMFFLIGTSIAKTGAVMTGEQSLTSLVDKMPKSMQTLFGAGTLDLSSAIGVYGVIFLYISFLGTIYAGMLGAVIFSKEERDKTFEFLYIKGVSRNKILTQKVLLSMVNLFIMTLVTYLVSAGLVQAVMKESIVIDIIPLMLGLFLMEVLFYSIGLFGSLWMKNSKKATGACSAVVMITFLLSILIEMNEKIEILRIFTPFQYYEAKRIIKNGLNAGYVILTLILIILCMICAFLLHKKRDLNI